MDTKFEGMKPWPLDSGMVECEDTDLGPVDLHNCCDFTGLLLDPLAGRTTVRMGFRLVEGDVPFEIVFDHVERLRIESRPAGDPTVLHGIDHYAQPDGGRSTFEIDLDSLTVVLVADKVSFVVQLGPVGVPTARTG